MVWWEESQANVSHVRIPTVTPVLLIILFVQNAKIDLDWILKENAVIVIILSVEFAQMLVIAKFVHQDIFQLV